MVWKSGEKETECWRDTILDLASYVPNPIICDSETHLDVTTTGIPTINFLLQLSSQYTPFLWDHGHGYTDKN
jgi:hypothetical protein